MTNHLYVGVSDCSCSKYNFPDTCNRRYINSTLHCKNVNIRCTQPTLWFMAIYWAMKHNYTPRTTKLLGGILVSLRPSVRPSVHPSVRPSRLPCPLCNIYSSGWILSILATNDLYHERVCRTQWLLTLTYIFKVIRPWLRKSCPLCSVYGSGWILFIFGTNDHYHSRVCRVLVFIQNLKIYSSQWILSIFSTNDH